MPSGGEVDLLVGLKVTVSINEGFPEEIVSLDGVLSACTEHQGRIRGLVTLEHATLWGRVTGVAPRLSKLKLERLVVGPAFRGDTLLRLLRKEQDGRWGVVPCSISNCVDPLTDLAIPQDSRLYYFARGAVVRR